VSPSLKENHFLPDKKKPAPKLCSGEEGKQKDVKCLRKGRRRKFHQITKTTSTLPKSGISLVSCRGSGKKKTMGKREPGGLVERGPSPGKIDYAKGRTKGKRRGGPKRTAYFARTL